MAKYRKKPVEIEAVKFSGNNSLEIDEFTGGKAKESPVLEPSEDNPTGQYLQLKTLKGTIIVDLGDFIIKNINGEFSTRKQDIFEKTYESVE